MCDFFCWFCNTRACSDWAHLLLMLILSFFAVLAFFGLVLFVGWLVSCAVNTSKCNDLACDSWRECQHLKARVKVLEKMCGINEEDKTNGK